MPAEHARVRIACGKLFVSNYMPAVSSIGDFLSDGERRRGAGAGSIQHVQRAIAFDEAKILQRLAIRARWLALERPRRLAPNRRDGLRAPGR